MEVPFNIPYTSTQSAENIKHLASNPHALSKREFTLACESWFRDLYPGYQAIMVPSCTRAMELIALSLHLDTGDEVIMPSYGYVGVANAFANTGARLVFADIDPQTMNIDSASLESCITPVTKAVVIMHYAGVACEMDAITAICRSRGILLIEDNAQGLGARYQGQALGSFGDFSCISFDTLKNISCSEGGVLLYKEAFQKRIETSFENGTNKIDFLKGRVPSYEWTAAGSNFGMSEYTAAVLYPLLQKSAAITQERKEKWRSLYHAIHTQPALRHLLTPGLLQYEHNGHIFFIKCTDPKERDALQKHLAADGIVSAFHYTPLHLSARAAELHYTISQDRYTSSESERLLRLPVYNALEESAIAYIAASLAAFYDKTSQMRARGAILVKGL